MKVINVSGDEHVLLLKSALMNLSQALEARRYRGTKVYRFAIARRFTVCYFAFLQYLVARLQVHEQTHHEIGLEALIHRCRRYSLFSRADERMIIQMSMVYAALSYYQEGFDASCDDLLLDIPRMVQFLERFIAMHELVPVRGSVLQATV